MRSANSAERRGAGSARNKNGSVYGAEHRIEIATRSPSAGTAAGDEQGVGEAARFEVVGLFGDGSRGERRGVLHVDVAEQRDVLETKLTPRAKGAVCSSFDDALVRYSSRDVDVDADHRSAGDRGDGSLQKSSTRWLQRIEHWDVHHGARTIHVRFPGPWNIDFTQLWGQAVSDGD